MAITFLANATNRVDFGVPPFMAKLTALSICITVRPTTVPTAMQRLVSQWSASAGDQAFLLQVGGTTNLDWPISAGSAVTRQMTTNTGFLLSGTTFRIVARWRAVGQTTSIYANGIAQGLNTTLGGNPASINNSGSAMQMGAETNEGINAIAADFSELAIFGRYLADEEAKAYGLGYSPELFWPGGRLVYARLRSTSDVRNRWSGISPTLVGGATAVHPLMRVPTRSLAVIGAETISTAAATGFGALLATHRNRLVIS